MAAAAGSRKKQSVRRKDASSSSESDFDDEEDPDSIQVPGGGKDLKTLSQIGGDVKPSLPSLAATPAAPADTLIMPSKPVVASSVLRPRVQQGYEVIRIQPGLSPFDTGVRHNASAMQQAIALVKSSVPGGAPIRVNVPLAAVQSLLRSKTPINISQLAAQQSQPGGSPITGVAGRLVQMQLQQFAQQGAGTFSMIRPGMQVPRGPVHTAATAAAVAAATREAEEENAEDEEENMGVAETYSDYMPTKLKLGGHSLAFRTFVNSLLIRSLLN